MRQALRSGEGLGAEKAVDFGGRLDVCRYCPVERPVSPTIQGMVSIPFPFPVVASVPIISPVALPTRPSSVIVTVPTARLTPRWPPSVGSPVIYLAPSGWGLPTWRI